MTKDTTFRLDRTKFKIQSFKEASNQYEYWNKQTLAFRLQAAYYLNSVAYNFDINNPPKLDKTKFSIRKHSTE